MNKTPESYWKEFKEHFECAIESVPLEDLKKAWESQTSRTEWYDSVLLPKVAFGMKLIKGNELLKVDFDFSEEVDGELVPMVFIESENQTSSADEEVRKLCNLHAPLKVLITCYTWKYFLSEGHIEKWNRIVQSYYGAKQQESVIGIIVAEENKGKYNFYHLAFSGGRLTELPNLLCMKTDIGASSDCA